MLYTRIIALIRILVLINYSNTMTSTLQRSVKINFMSWIKSFRPSVLSWNHVTSNQFTIFVSATQSTQSLRTWLIWNWSFFKRSKDHFKLKNQLFRDRLIRLIVPFPVENLLTTSRSELHPSNSFNASIFYSTVRRELALNITC